MGSPCDTDVKWILRAGFNVDPSTLAKNLTLLCTVAFSATVLYVAYSNSGKRPHYTDNNIQVCFPDDNHISEDDHTTQCETRCRHSVVGSSERCQPPDLQMRFGIMVQDAQSQSSRRACRLDPAVDMNSTSDKVGDLVVSGHNATTSDVCILDDRQEDKCFENKNAEKLNLPSLTSSGLNSLCDGIVAAESVKDGKLTTSQSSCTQTESEATDTASNHIVIESLFTQTPQSTVDAVPGLDVVENSRTQSSPSSTHNAPNGPNVMKNSYTQTPPSTTSTASGPDRTGDGNKETGKLGGTRLCEPIQVLPSPSGQAPDPLSAAGVPTSDHAFNLLREASEAHKDFRFMQENASLHSDPECTSARVDLLRHREESESQRRTRKEHRSGSEANSAEDMCLIAHDGDEGNHFVGYVYGIICEKGRNSCKRRLCGEVSFPKERSGHGDADCWRKLGSGEEVDIRCQDTCTQTKGGKPFDECSNSVRSQKIVAREFRRAEVGTVLWEDKATNTFLLDIYSGDPVTRGACVGRPLDQTTTTSKEKTQPLLGETSEKCRDKGPSTLADTIPTPSTKGSNWSGRPLKQTRTMPQEEARHSSDEHLGVFERCAQERREGSIASAHSQPVDPLEQTKRSLKALTETQHWSKMSLPEQYEYLGLLDSTLAAASAEWKGNWNVTYWRQKDSAPLSKLSGSSSLCKPQGSPKCPTADMVHSCFQGDPNCRNVPNSLGHEVEQYNVTKNGHQC